MSRRPRKYLLATEQGFLDHETLRGLLLALLLLIIGGLLSVTIEDQTRRTIALVAIAAAVAFLGLWGKQGRGIWLLRGVLVLVCVIALAFVLSQPNWDYKMVVGVGDIDGDGMREVLAVADDGTGEFAHVEPGRRITDAVSSHHDWQRYDHIVGIGNVLGGPTPEILVTIDKYGAILEQQPGGSWKAVRESEGEQPVNLARIGRDWSYEAIAVIDDVAVNHAPEVFGANWVGEGDTDALLYLRPGGIYVSDVDPSEELAEEGDYDLITGIGDVDRDDRHEVLAVIGADGFLLSFDADGDYVRTDLSGDWRYDHLTTLKVFGDGGPSEVLAVRNDVACILTFQSLGEPSENCES